MQVDFAAVFSIEKDGAYKVNALIKAAALCEKFELDGWFYLLGVKEKNSFQVKAGESIKIKYCFAFDTDLIRMTKKAMQDNRGSDMWEIANKKLSNVNGKTAFLSEDGTGKKVVKQYVANLAEGIVNIVNVFQPEIVCVGGGVSNAGDKIIKPVRTTIKNKSYARFGKKQSEVQISKLGNNAGIIGAALLWKDA